MTQTQNGAPIVRRALLNPFYMYSAIWSLILFLYSLGWSGIYDPLVPGLWTFFVITIASSWVLGWIFRSIFKFPNVIVKPPTARTSMLITGGIALGFMADFAYGRQIPALRLMHGAGFQYGEFAGIPTLHVVLVTFALFYVTQLAFHFSRTLERRLRRVYAMEAIAIGMLFVLLLNRGAMMLAAFMWALVLFSMIKMTARRLFVMFSGLAVILYLFGCIGNVRLGLPYWDNSYIMKISDASDRYPKFLPGQFLWTYIYMVSPLGNLNHTVATLSPLSDFGGALVNILPDVMTKRLFPDFDPTTPLVVPYYNVSTGFASAWKYYGDSGMAVTFSYLVFICILTVSLVRARFAVSAYAILCAVMAFMFFTNSLSYTGVSFALAYPIIGSLRSGPEEAKGRVRRTKGDPSDLLARRLSR